MSTIFAADGEEGIKSDFLEEFYGKLGLFMKGVTYEQADGQFDSSLFASCCDDITTSVIRK